MWVFHVLVARAVAGTQSSRVLSSFLAVDWYEGQDQRTPPPPPPRELAISRKKKKKKPGTKGLWEPL